MRQKDINLPVCAGNADGELLFYEISENGLSTLDRAIADLEKKAGWQVVERTSQVLTLNTILEKYSNGRTIHFLKIDVEGGEKTVLEGLDLSRWRPWILVIEATIPFSTELNCSEWEEILTTSHYELAYFDGLNRFYVAEERAELGNSLRVPPNFFDDFIVDDLYYAQSERDSWYAEWERVCLERDKMRAERDALRVTLNEILSSYSWHITAPLRKIIGRGRTADILNRLFPLRTLPNRAMQKMTRLSKESERKFANLSGRLFPLRTLPNRAMQKATRLSKEGVDKLINRVKSWVHGNGKAIPYFSIAEEHTPMLPQVKTIYLDLIRSIKETDDSQLDKAEKDK
jgi:hypothetical protein